MYRTSYKDVLIDCACMHAFMHSVMFICTHSNCIYISPVQCMNCGAGCVLCHDNNKSILRVDESFNIDSITEQIY